MDCLVSLIFSKFDLWFNYHQIMDKYEGIHKITFKTHDIMSGWFMSLGITNAHSTFQCLMNDIFQGLLRKFMLNFFL